MLYQVERLQIQYQFVEADSEEQAIEIAQDTGEWDTDSFSEDQELFYGMKAFVLVE